MAYLFLVSCGGGSGTNSPTSIMTTTVQQQSELVGNWEPPVCDIRANFSQNLSYSFNPDGTYSLEATSYLNSNCTEPTFTITSFGDYFEGSSFTLTDGRIATTLDLVQADRREATPLSQLGADGLSLEQVCGIADWQVGVSRSITGCSFGLSEVVTLPTIFQIYHLQDNYFFFIGSETSFSAQTRPQFLIPGPTLVRQIQAEDDFPTEVAGFWRSDMTDRYFEFRPNGVLFVYLPNEQGAFCHNITQVALRRVSSTGYVDGFGNVLSLEVTSTGLDYLDLTDDFVIPLLPETDIESHELTPCSSLPGGG